jgi:predicted dehydrogenase
MKVAVVGAGLIGHERLDALRRIQEEFVDAVQIAIVIDPDLDKLDEIKDSYDCDVSNELSQITAHNPDWVFICTPHEHVFPISKFCFQFEYNVLIEKPLGRSLSECNKITSLKPSKSKLFVGFNYRFYKGIRLAISDALNGEFGQIVSVNMILGHGNSPGMENSWKLDPNICGGGALIDPGIHLLDLVLCLAVGKVDILNGSCWSGFWKTGIEEECHLILKDSNSSIFNIQSSLNRWRSSFKLEINGTEGYGIVEGRGRSYGPQSYKKGKRWGWLGGSSQVESETIVINSDLGTDCFLNETLEILGLRVDDISRSHVQLQVCTETQASRTMALLDSCRNTIRLPILDN